MTEICWRIHLSAPPEVVYDFLDTTEGRESFWAESAPGDSEMITFTFPNGLTQDCPILERDPPRRFVLEYFAGRTAFELEADENGGTDLTLRHTGVDPEKQGEFAPGWVSVLLALKASVDFDIDLRNHDPDRTWDAGYVDN